METLSVIFWLYVAIAIHEFGHFAPAYVLRQPIGMMQVGVGRILHSTYWRGIHFQFRLIPIGGQVTYAWHSNKKWVNLTVTAGGPVANLLTALVLYLLSAIDCFLFGVSLFFGVLNLLPFDTNMGPSDGQQIVEEWKFKRQKPCRQNT